jgi:hypothetical protein
MQLRFRVTAASTHVCPAHIRTNLGVPYLESRDASVPQCAAMYLDFTVGSNGGGLVAVAPSGVSTVWRSPTFSGGTDPRSAKSPSNGRSSTVPVAGKNVSKLAGVMRT